MIHVALVDRHMRAELLAGRKRIESRLSRTCRPPFGCVRTGDTLCFKQVGGGWIGSARVTAVREYAGLSPRGVGALARQYGPAVRAPAEYWLARRNCRYAVLMRITRLAASGVRLRVPRQYGGAWVVLGRQTGDRR